MTHLLDSSVALAGGFAEAGVERVRSLLNDPHAAVGISVLTLYETHTRVLQKTGSEERARKTVKILRAAIDEVVPVDEAIVDLALDLRRRASARSATVGCLIAASAAFHGAILVHRDAHFAALPADALA